MKKLLSLLLIVINLNCFAQANKWFVSFSVTPTIGGPSASLKKQMREQHFDQTSTFSFLGLESTTNYPLVSKDVSLLFRGGKKIDDRRSIYFVVGQTAAGSVEGFKNEGYSDLIIIGSSYGQDVAINYNTYQLTAGYLYSFPGTRFKIGFGPSIFLFKYSIAENHENQQKHSSVIPGATFTTRLPLGKEKKLFGIELVWEGNMAPPARMKGGKGETGFEPGNVSMFSANAGIAFSFRR